MATIAEVPEAERLVQYSKGVFRLADIDSDYTIMHNFVVKLLKPINECKLEDYSRPFSPPLIVVAVEENEPKPAKEEEEEMLTLAERKEQYQYLFDMLPTEQVINLLARNVALSTLTYARLRDREIKHICLYKGSDGYPCTIVSRLKWNDHRLTARRVANNRVALKCADPRYQLDLERIENVHRIALLFKSVQTIEVVVQQFNFQFNTKLSQILTDFGGDLPDLVLIVGDDSESYHIGNITKFIRTMQCGVHRLQIIYSASKMKMSMEPFRIIENINIRETRVKSFCSLM